MKKWLSLLQIIAFLLVILFIISPQIFPGGFIGIDLALVLAGYYFSTRVIDGWIDKKQDHWKLFANYVLRTMGLILLVTLIAVPVAFVINRNYLADIGRQLSAAFGFSTNFYEIFFGGSFANRAEPHLFLHLWPISIVLQCSLVTGFFLTILEIKNKVETFDGQVKKLRKNIFLISGILALASLLYLIIGTILKVEPTTLFYSSLSHSLPFLLGSIVGSFIGNEHTPNKFLRTIQKSKATSSLLGFSVGILLLVALIFILRVDQTGTYIWGILLATLISCFLVIQGKVLSEKTFVQLTQIDLVSGLAFTTYLFFWPSYLVFASRINQLVAAVLALVLAGAVAFGLRFILLPVFKKSAAAFSIHYPKKIVLPSILVVSILLAVLTIVGVRAAPALSTSVAETSKANFSTSVTNMVNTNNNLGDYIEGELINDWKSILADSESVVDIAIYSPKYNRTITYTNTSTNKYFYTGSIVKVSVLAELMHQKELSGEELTATESDNAYRMITGSSNTATTHLLNYSLGGYDATTALFTSLGMTDTSADTEAWGMTMTTASDQLKLLNEIFYDGNYLNEESRTYIQELMGSVAPEQSWGISAGIEEFQIKNGWDFTNEASWTVNSIGHAYSQSDPTGYTIAILTDNSALQEDGQKLVEALSEKAAEHLAN